jgi:hypothetical protein
MLTIPGHKGNATQNHIRFYLIPVRISRTPPPTNVGEDVPEKEPSYAVGGNAN